ncbi:GTP 3',8-cyclase MoaA [Crateriforma conspicua]|nr:GTP 3',8-cyclase MoaA [Crateriforma conspicua]
MPRLVASMLVDGFGRKHTSLRISVTDRCNLRCTYCMPAVTPKYQAKSLLLTYEEIIRFTRVAVDLGVDDVRVTGGEPLVRADLDHLIAMLAQVLDPSRISLTTNGVLLQQQLPRLTEAGLRSVNVSLDALDETSFEQSTRRRGLSMVLDSIQAAVDAGMKVKVNAIAKRDFTESQLASFGHFANRTKLPVRFIEYMPLDADGNWDADNVLSGSEILRRLSEHFGPLRPLPRRQGAPAVDYKIESGGGTIGIVASVTEPFCQACNRIRLTADGKIRNCLFGDDSGDVRSLLRSGANDQAIADLLKSAMAAKKRGHGSDDLVFVRPSRPMYSIGG